MEISKDKSDLKEHNIDVKHQSRLTFLVNALSCASTSLSNKCLVSDSSFKILTSLRLHIHLMVMFFTFHTPYIFCLTPTLFARANTLLTPYHPQKVQTTGLRINLMVRFFPFHTPYIFCLPLLSSLAQTRC